MVEQTGAAGDRGWPDKARGVIVRHLVLPGLWRDSVGWCAAVEGISDGVMISLMSQYTPMPGVPAELDRRIRTLEYRRGPTAEELGFAAIHWSAARRKRSIRRILTCRGSSMNVFIAILFDKDVTCALEEALAELSAQNIRGNYTLGKPYLTLAFRRDGGRLRRHRRHDVCGGPRFSHYTGGNRRFGRHALGGVQSGGKLEALAERLKLEALSARVFP